MWGEGTIQEQLDGAVRNKVIYQQIAKQLNTLGYKREWDQCRNKVKNLKKEYRIVKDNNDETGRARKTCKFYKELDSILGHRPASVPTVLLDTGSCRELDTGSQYSQDEFPELDTNGKEVKHNIDLTYYRLQMEMAFKHSPP